MTDDIVTRLREGADYEHDTVVMEEAADEIERLRALIANCIAVEEHLTDEIERLRAALREVAEAVGDSSAYWIARIALEGEKTND